MIDENPTKITRGARFESELLSLLGMNLNWN